MFEHYSKRISRKIKRLPPPREISNSVWLEILTNGSRTKNSLHPIVLVLSSSAVICILDRTNLVDAHEDVLLCLEDFLWIKLAQIQISNETLLHDRTIAQLTVPRLQRWIIRDLGEDYFKAYDQPFRYARILLLCGAFESACEFLFKLPSTKVHAIHLAIYFCEKNLLGLTSAIDECMIIMPGNSQQNKVSAALNLQKFIELYLKDKFIHDQRYYWQLINYTYALINIDHLEAGTEFRRLLIELATNLDDLNLVYGKWIIVNEDADDGADKTIQFEGGLHTNKCEGNLLRIFQVCYIDYFRIWILRMSMMFYWVSQQSSKNIIVPNFLLLQHYTNLPKIILHVYALHRNTSLKEFSIDC